MTLHSNSNVAQHESANLWRRAQDGLFRRAHAARNATIDLCQRLHARSACRPVLAIGLLLGTGLAVGAATGSLVGAARVSSLQATTSAQAGQLDGTRRAAQREVNALAARLGELQAEANRLNALGERLTRIGQLGDGEFDFDKPVGVGGEGPVRDMPAGDLRRGMDTLGLQLTDSGRQLSVLESLLFNRALDKSATPSREPIANSYITSPFGGRADPFGGGGAFHKGIDFHANIGDPVLAVADGVVSYAGTRSGYGNVIEVDHGNGYVTRYAHNSRLLAQVGDLVRSGQQVAKAGSTGRSTGAHVHFEVWENGHVVNPRKFLGEQGVTRG
jgi:murein DD-endopeptidase MepM/ murein hydrolase activator NlpD